MKKEPSDDAAQYSPLMHRRRDMYQGQNAFDQAKSHCSLFVHENIFMNTAITSALYIEEAPFQEN